MLLPEGQVDQQGIQAFQQLQQQTPTDSDPIWNNFVHCIVSPLATAARDQTPVKEWDVKVFKADQTINAFALPGGKIGVYSGILKVTKTDAQLAAVLAHEMSHVISRHGDERVSQGLVAQLGMAAAQVSGANPTVIGLLGMGAQVGVILPFSRAQETEADLVGLDLMARAGFDPRQSIDLWNNMKSASGGKAPPAILSDHPSDDQRIQRLQEHMGAAVAKYDQARAVGLAPHCALPK